MWAKNDYAEKYIVAQKVIWVYTISTVKHEEKVVQTLGLSAFSLRGFGGKGLYAEEKICTAFAMCQNINTNNSI